MVFIIPVRVRRQIYTRHFSVLLVKCYLLTLTVADMTLPGVRLMIQYGVWSETDGAKLKCWEKYPSQGHLENGGNHKDMAFFQVSLLNVRRCHHHHQLMTSGLNVFNTLNPELNPMCCLLALLGADHFLHVSRIRVKSLTLRLLMLYIWSTHS